MARVLVTRARLEAEETAHELAARGHEAILAPLRILDVVATPLPPQRPDALIATSRNSFVQDGEWPAGWLGLPVYCVGEKTAEAARNAGFGRVFAAQGDAGSLFRTLAAKLPHASRLLYLAGEPRRPELEDRLRAAGFMVEILPRYRMVRVGHLPEAARDTLATGVCDAVLHFSAESARAFFALAEAADLAREAKIPLHACLSSAVADAARHAADGTLLLAIAPKRTGSSLIAMLDTHLR